MKYLIAGLGNIGSEYDDTRHNIGFMVLDSLAKDKGLNFEQDRHVFKTSFKFKGREFHLIKPTTYMNLSGKAVKYWMDKLKIPKENLLVITDDIALPVAKLRLKPKGSAGGHNGLKNIEELLQSNVYPRLKFGVGDDFPKGRQADYVLGKFVGDEKIDVSLSIDKAKEVVTSFALQGVPNTMNQYN